MHHLKYLPSFYALDADGQYHAEAADGQRWPRDAMNINIYTGILHV